MNKFFLGFVSAIVLIGLIYLGYLVIPGFFSSGLVSPEELDPNAKDFGTLRVEVFGDGNPLSQVEVDLGKIGPGGPIGKMSAVKTDESGTAVFKKVPVGTYDVFWNTYAFPKEYSQPESISIEIIKDEIVIKRFDLIKN